MTKDSWEVLQQTLQHWLEEKWLYRRWTDGWNNLSKMTNPSGSRRTLSIKRAAKRTEEIATEIVWGWNIALRFIAKVIVISLRWSCISSVDQWSARLCYRQHPGTQPAHSFGRRPHERWPRPQCNTALLCLCNDQVIVFIISVCFFSHLSLQAFKRSHLPRFPSRVLGTEQGPWGWFKRFWANQGINKFPFNYTHNGKKRKHVSEGLGQILSIGECYNNSDKLKKKQHGKYWILEGIREWKLELKPEILSFISLGVKNLSL